MGYSQCLMCKYVMGRSCKLLNEVIKDAIYNNEIICEKFHSITDLEIDEEDKCCDESKRFHENASKYEKMA